MKLRGGASLPELVLGASATAATASGLGIVLGQAEFVHKFLWFGMTNWGDNPLLGVSILGWGIGKIVATMAGDDAIKQHCKMGAPLMVLSAYILMKDQGVVATILPLTFAAAYGFIGYA